MGGFNTTPVSEESETPQPQELPEMLKIILVGDCMTGDSIVLQLPLFFSLPPFSYIT
jgi:hypothetical protein